MNISKVISEKISGIDWQRIIEEMNEKGYALVLQFLPAQYCEELIREYDNSDLYRKTITMERHSFGLGEYKYFKYPLPDLIQTVRTEIYPKLASVANRWMNEVDGKATIQCDGLYIVSIWALKDDIKDSVLRLGDGYLTKLSKDIDLQRKFTKAG